MTEEIKRKPGQRGPSKKGAMEHITIRVPKSTMDFFRTCERPSDAMRAALKAYADTHS